MSTPLKELPGVIGEGHHADGLAHAIIIAAIAHSGQTDKQGEPYILHALRVMLAVSAECRIPAVLHDVVEDTRWTVRDLSDEGVALKDISMIERLSRREDELYDDYILRVAKSAGCREIKMADILDNNGRIGELSEADQARLRPRYQKAWQTLLAAGSVKVVSTEGGEESDSPSRTRTYDHSINRSSVQGDDLAVQSEASRGLDDKIGRTDTDSNGLDGGNVSIECQESSPDEPKYGLTLECDYRRWVPAGELWLTDRYGTVVGKIVGVTP